MTLPLKNRSPKRSETQVELEIERRLNGVQKDPGGRSRDVRMIGSTVDYDPIAVTEDYTLTGNEGTIIVNASQGKVTLTIEDISAMGYNIINIYKSAEDTSRNDVLAYPSKVGDKIGNDEKGISVDISTDCMSIQRISDTEMVMI